jgi:hypothetical protein
VTQSPPVRSEFDLRRWSLADIASGYLLAARFNSADSVDIIVGLPLPFLSIDVATLRRRVWGRQGGDDS